MTWGREGECVLTLIGIRHKYKGVNARVYKQEQERVAMMKNIVKPFHSDPFAKRLCRAYLCLGGTASLGLAIALLVFGSSKADSKWFSAPDATFLLDPYVGMTAVGALTLPLSVMSIASGLSANRLVLYAFMGLSCFAVVLEVYVSVLCFLCARTSANLSQKLAGFVTAWAALNGPSVAAALAGGGAVLVGAAALAVLSIAAGGRVAGCTWARVKMPGMLTGVNLALAAALLALAVAVDAAGSDDNTRFGIVAGCFGICNSILGWVALFAEFQKTTRAHVYATLFVAVVSALVAAACIGAGTVRAGESVCEAVEAAVADVHALAQALNGTNATTAPPPPSTLAACVVPGRLTSDRLMLLGSFAITSSFSALAEAALWAYKPVAKVKKEEAVIQMYEQFVQESGAQPQSKRTREDEDEEAP